MSESDYRNVVCYSAPVDCREGKYKPENLDLTINFHTDGMPDAARGNDIPRGDLDTWCSLKRHTYTNEALASFMTWQSSASCYMKDPPGNVEARFWVKPIRGSGFIKKYGLANIQQDVNQAMATRIQGTSVS